jgi:hypothetical protein
VAADEGQQREPAREPTEGTVVHPGWGHSPPLATAPNHLSRASTVQVLGVFSIVTLPLCGVGLVLALITLAMGRTARRELHAAGGRGPGGREVTVGTTCAWIALAVGGLFLVAVIGLLAFAVAGSTSP